MSDIHHVDDESSKKLVETADSSKYGHELKIKSELQQKEEFQLSGHKINSSLNPKLYFNFSDDCTHYRVFNTTFRQKCELVIEPQKSSKTPYRRIIISGLKGTGKTALAKKLSTELFNTIKLRYIFYFNCSKINLDKETTLLKFLSENIYINSPEKTLDNETLINLEHSNKMIIVIDDAMNIEHDSADAGLRVPASGNEYHRLSTHSSTDSSIKFKQDSLTNTGHNYLSEILNGEIMRKSIKIVTRLLSAPLNSYLRYLKLDIKNILLLGLNHDSQLKIFKSFGEKNERNVEKYLQNHPGLLDFCYMPDICFLTAHCINELLISSTSKTFFPNNLTDIFVYLLGKLVSDTNLFDFNLLTGICDLAWQGIKNNKIEFDLSNLSEMSLNLNSQSLKNLSANINKGTLFLFKFSSPNTFHFTISLLQEFFAAIYLTFMMPFDEFKMLNSTKLKFDLDNYQNKYITRFIFGLCNDVTLKSLHKINSSFFNSTDKMSLLHTISCEANSPIITLDNTILQHLACVHELHNHSYTQSLASQFSNEIKVDCMFCQDDISAFFNILQARHEPVTITALSNKNFIDDSWKLFFTLARSSSMKMLSLDLSWNKFGNEGAAILSQCLSNVKQLILQYCDITTSVVEIISNKIRELDEPMLSLDLSRNKFGNEGAAFLSQCLNNVKQLILQDCDITAPGVESISNKICELDEPIENLDLYGNKVDNKGFTAISSCLDKIVKLEIGSHCDSELTMEGIKTILSAAENTPNPLLKLKIYCEGSIEKQAKREAQKYQLNIWINGELKSISELLQKEKYQTSGAKMLSLDLSDEKIDNSNAAILFHLDSKIDQLILKGCGITAPRMEAISEKILNLEKPLLLLDLSRNHIGNRGAAILSHCLHKIKELNLRSCCITEAGVEAISNQICEFDEPMLSLDLSFNYFCDEGAAKLSPCFHKIKKLNLRSCNISETGVEAISKKIHNLDKPMSFLDLSKNRLGIEGATILSRCLHNVKQLILEDCEVTAPGVEAISNKICQLDEPMEHVNLDDNKVGNKGFTAISSCLHKIVKLTIGAYDDSKLTMKGIKTILSAVEKMPFPLLELKINCQRSIEKEAKREAQKHDSNIWIRGTKVSFQVENVKKSVEIEYEKHVESVEEVKAYLLNEAERLSKPHRPLFLQNTIHNIDLDLSTKVKNNLSTTSEKHDDLFGIGDLYKIFQTASNEMKQSGNFSNDKDKSKFVFLVGNAGSGKTTIIKALLQKYFQDKTLCGFDFAFFLHCSHLNRNCDYNYLEFLIKNFPYAWIKNNAMCDVVLKKLENKKTCLLIDDLNLFNLSLQKLSAKCDRNENHLNAQTLLWDVLLGKLFPNSLKFVTFRPLQFLEFMKLPDNLRPSPEIVYIYGVNQNSQVKIFQSLCSSNFDLTVTYLKVYPQLHSFCNILANSLAVVQSINGHLQHSTVNIKSSSNWNNCIPLTSVFVSSLLMITRNSGIQYNLIDLSDAVKLAWRQFADQLTVLETNKVLSYHRHDIIDVFLQICVAKEDSTSYELTFPRLLSDCFIAMYLLYFHESFDSVLTCLLDRKGFSDNIVKFVFGLCNSSVKVYFKKLLPPCGNFVEKSESLKKKVMNYLKSLNQSDENFASNMLFLCCLVFEMHDRDFAKKVADFLPNIIVLSTEVASDEVLGFYYVLSARSTNIEIMFEFTSKNKSKELFKLAQGMLTKHNPVVHFKDS